MVTKTAARDANVDWSEVEKLTEIKRTYLVKDKTGKEFFKMYKPSEAQKIFKEKGYTGKIVSRIERKH